MLAPGESLTTDGPRLVLYSQSGTEVIIRPIDESKPFKDATHLLIQGGPYATENEAIRAGKSWRRQLLMACSDRSIGIDIGDEAELRPLRIPLSQREFSPDDIVILKQRHGLQVYPVPADDATFGFSAFTADLAVGRSSEGLLTAIREVGPRASQMSARQTLALSLLHASRFAENPETKYVLLVTAVEALIKRADQSKVVRELLTSFQDAVRDSDLSDEERTEVVGHLSRGKVETIGAAGRRLAAKLGDNIYGGVDPSTYFGNVYKIRSNIVHGNMSRPDHEQLRSEYGELHRFVVELLHKIIVS